MSTASKSRPRKSKHVLAVRMLVAKTDWLDGHLRWQEGHIAWCGPHGRLVPTVDDLARAQRCLVKMADYPHAARIALGDGPAWLARRSGRLQLAKRLRDLPLSDLESLSRQALQGKAEAAASLTSLLVAEALCLNALPASPGTALLALKSRAVRPLQSLLDDDDSLPAACALAALLLGAVERVTEPSPRQNISLAGNPWFSRCREWGTRHGLPDQAPMVVALLADPKGEALAERFLVTLPSPAPFRLPTELLREWLAEGVDAGNVVSLAEACVAAAPLAGRISRYRDGLPKLGTSHDRHSLSKALRAERTEAINDLVPLFHAYAQSTRDLEALAWLTVVAQNLYSLADSLCYSVEAFPALHETVLLVLRAGLKFEPSFQVIYLSLLAKRREELWKREDRVLGRKPDTELPRFRGWLHDCWSRHVSPLCRLLVACEDRTIVERILDLDMVNAFAKREWRDPAMFPLALTMMQWFGVTQEDYSFGRFCTFLEEFSTAREARVCLKPLTQALQNKDPRLRQHLFWILLSEAGVVRQTGREALSLLTPHLRLLGAFVEADGDTDELCLCETAIGTALALSRSTPAQADARLRWLLPFLTEHAKRKAFSYETIASLEIGTALAAALAAEDEAAFEAIVRTASEHRFRQDRDQIRRSLGLLSRFPALRSPLARLFPQQPQRCADLLVRLGLTTRLNTDAAAILARLEPQSLAPSQAVSAFPVVLCPHDGWWRIHRIAPELTTTANAFLHAQWVLRESTALPPGVRRVLETPHRMARELEHLEQMPMRPHLAARAEKLRDALGHPDTLTAGVRSELGERLIQIGAQVQIAAAEQQILACYRSRLEVIAGPLPDGLEFNADLINATLLSVDIEQNRRPLLRLLRAHIVGERGWREAHPANQAFLASLRDKGVDSDLWLSEKPRRYRCAVVPGSTVHLRLECDPLSILQMGNYFDTCLSFGGINAFSTVANACDLNKRVVYARDGAGHVIARKLIGINADGDLIGFHTYASLTDEAHNQALRGVVQRYVMQFAERCRLRLSDQGTVPTLMAETWYDDGLVKWDDGERIGASSPVGATARPVSDRKAGDHSSIADRGYLSLDLNLARNSAISGAITCAQ